ncbi:hypothetical protein [Gryllotalpicola ginsengisoli]|uniref:hypothetical protein n=1 Tax=Gryllotalpicola ginsengisoli TaxID=444608 RepID=UPI0003B2FEC6|nr:hypothetical protein [Gryllotalpicola ginsengisoli]
MNRAAPAFFSFVLGLVLGTVGTFGHRGVIGVGSVNLYWGIVVALIGAACFLVGLRLYTSSRIVTLAGAIGLLAPIALFSVQGPGGSVVIAQGTLGWLWELGPAVVAVLVLAWPKLPTRAA